MNLILIEMTPDASRSSRSALIVAHPGHELRVHYWLEIAEPLVLVLTDGSGSAQQSRLQSTASVLQGTGARPGEVYGFFSDAGIYSALLNSDFAVFQELLERLASILIQEQIELVAGDALEGYNPSHDVCRYLINSSLELVYRKSGRRIANYDFPVAGPPRRCSVAPDARVIGLRLDETAWQRKWNAAMGYPELVAEIERALVEFGEEPLREEWLYPIVNPEPLTPLPEEPPFYERHGEKRCREGLYQEVIRYCQHLKPLAEALWRHATGGAP